MKKILKYQLKDLSTGYAVYALVMFLLTAFTGIIAITHNDINITIHGNGLASAIFCMVMGISIYKEHCQMAVLNSVSRKDFFQSNMYISIISGFLCALLDLFLAGIRQLAKMSPSDMDIFAPYDLLQALYPGFFEEHYAVFMAVNFLLALIINVFLFLIGTLIAGVYCRLPKKYRTVYCIALPVFGVSVGLSPFLMIAALIPGLPGKLIAFFEAAMGISSNNPFLGILTLSVISLLMACICYRILKKTEFA